MGNATSETKAAGSATVAKVLVCEDDDATRQLLADHLTADRYEVLTAATAAEALQLCETSTPDMLLLDLTLPDNSGLDLLRQIREQDSGPGSVGVIVVSGRGTERDRVRGLSEGADDYGVKPFSYGELIARINAVLRRRKHNGANQLTVGELTINKDEQTVKVGTRAVHLTKKEFSLLFYLASEPTRVFSKEEILREVWGYRSIGHTRTLETLASQLGEKLNPDKKTYVVCCWCVGYRLVGP